MAVVAVGLAGHFDAWSTGRLARRALMLLGAIAASAVVGLALLVLLGQQPGRTLALRRRQ